MPTPSAQQIKKVQAATAEMTNLDLFRALRFVKDGYRITNTAWDSKNIFVSLHGGIVSIKGADSDGLYHPWTLSATDLLSTEFEVVTVTHD